MFEQMPDVQEILAHFVLYLIVFAIFVIVTGRMIRSALPSIGAVLVLIVAGFSSLALSWWGYHHQELILVLLAWVTVLGGKLKLK
jgi:hypothetical protein